MPPKKMPPKKRRRTGLQPVADSIGVEGRQFRCAGFQRYGAPCKWRVENKGDKCHMHINDPKQEQKEAHGRKIVAKGGRLTTVIKINAQWSRLEMEMRDKGWDWTEFVKGLDPEELGRGQIRDERGQFSGPAPSWVPREFHQACVAELMTRGKELYRSSFLKAVECFTQIIDNKHADDSVRLKAAQYIWERMEGRIPEKVEVSSGQSPWEAALADAIVSEEEMMQRARESLALEDD